MSNGVVELTRRIEQLDDETKERLFAEFRVWLQQCDLADARGQPRPAPPVLPESCQLHPRPPPHRQG